MAHSEDILTEFQGVGAASMLVPMYIAEVSPPMIRGRLVGTYEIAVQAGTCIGFWINYGVKINIKDSIAQWMTPFAVQLIPGGLLIIGMLFLPDSPRLVRLWGFALVVSPSHCYSDGMHVTKVVKKLFSSFQSFEICPRIIPTFGKR